MIHINEYICIIYKFVTIFFFSTYLEDEGSEWMMVVVREERETITKNKKN